MNFNFWTMPYLSQVSFQTSIVRKNRLILLFLKKGPKANRTKINKNTISHQKLSEECGFLSGICKVIPPALEEDEAIKPSGVRTPTWQSLGGVCSSLACFQGYFLFIIQRETYLYPTGNWKEKQKL